jgi:Golgi phosphoprotein 3 (GPP34)
MDIVRALPARMYLLAYDLDSDGPGDTAWLDYVVRGAALAQLLAEGRLTDTGDAVVTVGERPADEVLAVAYRQAEEAKAHTWRGLLHQGKATLAAVEDWLVRAGVFKRKSGHVVAADREAVAALQARARQVLRDGAGGQETDVLDAALVAVASVIPLRTVFDRRRMREDRARVDALACLVSARAPGFERLLTQMRRTRGRSQMASGPAC